LTAQIVHRHSRTRARHWHARQRIVERYGERLTEEMHDTIVRLIRRERKRHRQRRAGRTRGEGYRPPEAGYRCGHVRGERWWVRVRDRIYDVVVDVHSWTIITFLPAAIGGKPA